MSSDSVGFDRAAGFYDATRGFPPGVDRDVAALIAQTAALTPASRVLEIGAGTGRIALPLAQHTGAVIGLDIAWPMLARLQEKRSGERVFVAQGDATALPFRAGVFDHVLAVHVLHLIPGWRQVLDEVQRVLRPGGLLLLGNNNRGEGHPGLQALTDAWQSAVHGAKHAAVGMSRSDEDASLASMGWQRAGEDHAHHFTMQRTPQDYIDQLVQRCWSMTWEMSDEELARGVEAVRAAAAQQFPDPAAPVEATASFTVRAYRSMR